jgi:hypothetical protein
MIDKKKIQRVGERVLYTDEHYPEPVCPICDQRGESPHVCPYAQEIGGSNRVCTCCSGCQYQCAMDI